VCPRNDSFVDRVREVTGFDLNRIDRLAPHGFPMLPASIPLVYSKGRRIEPFKSTAAAISLFQLFERANGGRRFDDRSAVCNYFGIDRETALVVSGTGPDAPLERWWSLGERRLEILAHIVDLRVVAATAPNFSVFSDVPRWDNFHAMKRIAICWAEMVSAGIPTALHVNARTSQDWRRWTDFVRTRDEVAAISYEFATGAAGPYRLPFHVDELRHLADRVKRPLKLVVRGAIGALDDLRQSFAHVTMLDSTTYMKTVNRKIGEFREGRLVWKDAPGRPAVCLHELFEHNHLTMLGAASPHPVRPSS